MNSFGFQSSFLVHLFLPKRRGEERAIAGESRFCPGPRGSRRGTFLNHLKDLWPHISLGIDRLADWPLGSSSLP